jgi:hypothetical protein
MPPRRSRKPKPIVRKRTTRASAKKRRLSAKRQPAAQVKRNSRKENRVKQRRVSGAISSGRRRVSRKSRNNNIRLTKHMKANDDMTIIELQKMAREQGIPFGGLSKSKLLRKINNYLESSY